IGGSLAKVVYFTHHASPFPSDGTLSFKDSSPSSSSSPPSSTLFTSLSFREPSPVSGGGRLNFIKFETEHIHECIQFLKQLLNQPNASFPKTLLSSGSVVASSNPCRIVLTTGGGAYKFSELLSKELAVAIDKKDEMECLVRGLNFLVKNVPKEVFTYKEGQPIQFEETPPENAFPYL
ncbi:hypothetical protein HMI56_004799, partial [Coelomomyces lativittatus]